MIRKARALPEIDRLREGVAYNPETGKMVWRVRPVEHFAGERADREHKRWNGVYAGSPALSYVNTGGYLCGHFDRISITAHRAAWAIHYGYWPDEIDHINGDRTDNRIENLRDVSRSENNKNKARRLGVAVQGVRKGRHRDNWTAEIRADGKSIHIGTFDTFEAAAAARRSAEESAGFHPNHGRVSR